METIKRILVACTMVKDCEKALHSGISLAITYGAELYVLYSVYDPFLSEEWNLPYMPMGAIKKDYQRLMKKTREELEAAVVKERKGGVVIKELVREGDPSKEIFKVIKEQKIDLLVLLAYEESRLEHLLFGRGTHELVRKMPCSIFLVKKRLQPAP
jgi:universal stress protein A